MKYDSFGRMIAKNGDHIRITNKVTKATLEGKAVYDILSTSPTMSVELDGASLKNIFKISEWTVEVVVPPLKPGIYVRGVLFYRVTEHNITVTSFATGDVVNTGQSDRGAYARSVQEGAMKFIGELP